MKKFNKITITLFIIFSMVFPFYLASMGLKSGAVLEDSVEGLTLSATPPSDANITAYNATVTNGNDLQETISYNFSADLLDTASGYDFTEYPGNASRTYEAGWVEYEYEDDADWFDSETENISSTSLDNQISLEPGQGDISINNGSWTYADELEDYDNSVIGFNSTEAYNYTGTFSFYDDAVGADPFNWIITETGTCTGNVIEIAGNHRKVLELYDGDANTVIARQFFDSDQTSGVIEFWLKTSDVGVETYIRFKDDATDGITLRISGSFLQYENGGWNNIVGVVADTWYHIKIIFDCGLYGLEGLAADYFYIFIDGTQFGQYVFNNGIVNINSILLETDAADAVYYTYFDAFGYSWASGYNETYDIGDNYNWNNYPGNYDFENYNNTLSGNYYGSYSFEEDAVGSIPAGWSYQIGPGGDIEVLAALGGHNKVVEISNTLDGAADRYAAAVSSFDDREYGTIEFWLRMDDTDLNHANYVFFRHGTDSVIRLHIQTNIFYYWDPVQKVIPNSPAAVDDTWYHITLHFECSTGGYQGLSQYKCEFLIDGVSSGELDLNMDEPHMDNMRVSGSAWHKLYSQFLDAVSYSWNPANYSYCQNGSSWNYNYDFKSWNKNSNNMSYLLQDDWDYRGVLGGTYSIESEFGIHQKYLQIYDDTDSYYYRATHDFMNVFHGEDPSAADGWVISEGAGCSINIDTNYGSHSNVMEIIDNNNPGIAGAINVFSEGHTSGTIDFWTRSTTTNKQFGMVLEDGGQADSIYFALRNTGQFAYHDGVWNDIGAYAANTWYHIRIEFDIADDWHIWINGKSYDNGVGYPFRGAPLVMDQLEFTTGSTEIGIIFYIDAVGYSWDPNYISDLYGSDNGEAIGCQIWNEFSSNQTSGNVSFWIDGDLDKYVRIYLMEENRFITSITLNESNLYYLDGDEWIKEREITNQWQYIKIEFDVSTDTYNLYLLYSNYTYCDQGFSFNLTSVNSGMDFQQTTSAITGIMFETLFDGSATTYKIDALTYSWETSCFNYNLIPNNFTVLDYEINLYINDFEYLVYTLNWAIFHSSNYKVNFSIYNYDTERWEMLNAVWEALIGETYNTTQSQQEWTNSPTLNFTGALNSYKNGTDYLKFRFKIIDFDSEFWMHLDQFRIDLINFVNVTVTHDFDWRGIWRYRFYLIDEFGPEAVTLSTNWTYYEIVPIHECQNFEAISESEDTTYWELVGSGVIATTRFSDDLTAGSWALDGIILETFEKTSTERHNYLLDNYTITDTIAYSGEHFDVSAQDANPMGMCWDNNSFWVVGYATDEVYQYTADGTYTTVHFDVGTEETTPTGMCWNGTNFLVIGRDNDEVYEYDLSGVYTTVHFDLGIEDNEPMGICWDGTHFWVVGSDTDEVYQYTADGDYTTVHFDVGAQDIVPQDIYWDGTHFWVLGSASDEVYQYTAAGVYTGIHFDVGINEVYPTGMCSDGYDFWVVGSITDVEVFEYGRNGIISKMYHGGGYIYIQTNITESPSISRIYGSNYTMEIGEYFEFDIESTASDIIINLYSGGILQDTLSILSGSSDSSRQTIRVYLLSDLTFDEMEFVGTNMVDTEYFICYDIIGEGYDITSNVYGIYIDPDGQDYLMCNASDYTLNIYDEVTEDKTMIFIESRNITLDEFILLTEIYIPVQRYYLKIYHYGAEISTLEYSGPECDYFWNSTLMGPDEILELYFIAGVYQINWTNGENNLEESQNITLDQDRTIIYMSTYYSIWFRLFDQNVRRLEDTLFSLYINDTLQEFGLVELYSNDTLITVYDQLNITCYNQTQDLSSFTEYNIYITVFELEFRLLSEENGNFSLSETTTHNFINFTMSPNSNRIYILSQSTYNITWWNGEDGITLLYDLILTTNEVMTFNTTYYSTYFSLYDQGFVRLDDSLFTLYINGTRKDFGFINLESDDALILVQDALNVTVFNQIETLYGIAEYNIYITVYEIEFRLLAAENGNFSLSETTTHAFINFTMSPDSSRIYTLSQSSYNITWWNGEDGTTSLYDLILTTNEILNFNSTYHEVYFSIFSYDGLGISHDLVRFYINNDRCDLGRNLVRSNTADLIVLDFFNNTLVNETIDASAYSEYNMFVEIYSLYIMNQFSYYDLVFNITQDGSGVFMSQLIPASSALLYRFLPNLDYTLNSTFINGSSYSTITLNLTNNVHIESFGVKYELEEYPKNVYIGIYTGTGLGIQHDLLRLYVSGNRTNFGFNTIYSEITQVTVRDYFNSTLFNDYVNMSGIYELNIYVDLHLLKIKNEGREFANYSLTVGANTTTGIIVPQEIIEYQLAPNTYSFAYTNQENQEYHSFTIVLDQDRLILMNSTYYNVYFSLYDQNNIKLDDSLFSLFINGTRKDFGFIELESNSTLVLVRDYLNITVYNQIENLTGIDEFIIYITVFEVQFRLLSQEIGNFSLSETTNHVFINFSMAPDSIRFFKLAQSIYNITWYNGENGITSLYDLILTTNEILTFNTTYYNTYFSLYDQNEVRLDDSLFSLYINGTRKDFGFIELQSDDTLILVRDYLNITVFNQVESLSGIYEYNIYITVFEVQFRLLAQEVGNFSLSETTSHNFINFSIAPDSIKFFYLAQSTYNITWYNAENAVTSLYDLILTTNEVLTFNTTYYNVYFSLYNQGFVRLDDSLFTLYINGTRKDFGFVELESNDVLILVQDALNVTVFNQVETLWEIAEYNIYITVHELQFRLLAREIGNFSLSETTTHNFINFSMTADSLRIFVLSQSSYNITWYNSEDGSTLLYDLILTGNEIMTFNTTYYTIYFSVFADDGLGVDPYLLKFYINGERADFGAVELQQNTNTLRVFDFFNVSLYNSAINLEGATEYNIYIGIRTLILHNNYTHAIKLIVSRSNVINYTTTLPSASGMSLRLLPNVKYIFYAYYVNDTFIESKTVKFEDEGQIVSFGFWQDTVYPEPIILDQNLFIWFIIFLVILVIISFVLYVKLKTKKENAPTYQKYGYNKKGKTKPGTFNQTLS